MVRNIFIVLLILLLGVIDVRQGGTMMIGGKAIKCLGVYGDVSEFWGKGGRLDELGINAVFVGAGGLSQDFINRCHREGARVYVEIGIFVGKELAQKHLDLWPINAEGRRMEPEGWYLGLCPTRDWYRQERVDKIKGILEGYPVDGIWLDFIRYPCHWEVPKPRLEQSCFCDSCLAKFAKATGIEIKGETVADKAGWILKNHESRWTKWKCQQISSFVKAVKGIIGEVRPEAILGIFSVPWVEGDYGDAIHKIIGQDYVGLAKYVDVFSPMVYHRMCGRGVDWVGDVVLKIYKMTKRDIWPIVQAINEPQEVTAGEFEVGLKNGLSDGSTGVLVFTFADVLKEQGKVEVLKRVYMAKIEG